MARAPDPVIEPDGAPDVFGPFPAVLTYRDKAATLWPPECLRPFMDPGPNDDA